MKGLLFGPLLLAVALISTVVFRAGQGLDAQHQPEAYWSPYERPQHRINESSCIHPLTYNAVPYVSPAALTKPKPAKPIKRAKPAMLRRRLAVGELPARLHLFGVQSVEALAVGTQRRWARITFTALRVHGQQCVDVRGGRSVLILGM